MIFKMENQSIISKMKIGEFQHSIGIVVENDNLAVEGIQYWSPECPH
jgi:hypothetical protein